MTNPFHFGEFFLLFFLEILVKLTLTCLEEKFYRLRKNLKSPFETVRNAPFSK